MAGRDEKLPPQPDFSPRRETIHEDFSYASETPEPLKAPPAPARQPVPEPAAGPVPEPKKEADPGADPARKQFSAPGKDADEIDFLKYLSIVLRRKKVVFITLFGLLFLNLVKDMGRTDQFKAETKLLVQVRKPNPIGEQDYSYFWDQQTRINTMLNTIKSREILKRVIDSLDLNLSVNTLFGAIGVSKVQETNIILLTATLEDPERAASVANRLAREFIAFNNEITRKDITDAITYIEKQIAKTETELREREEALKNFQQENRLVEQAPSSDMDVEKLSNLEVALQGTLMAIVENDEKINQVTKLLKREKMYVEQSFTFDNTVESQLVQLNVELARALAEYGEKHRSVWQLKENIKKLTELAKLSQEGKNRISSTKSLNENRQKLLQEYNDRFVESNALRAKRDAYERVLNELNTSIKAIPEKYLTLRRLQRDKENIEKIYDLLQSKYQEQRIRYEMQSSDVVQWEEAAVPRNPVPQGTRFAFLVVVLVGLIAGVGLAFGVEFLDQSVKSPQEIEEELNLPLLGVVPMMMDEDKVLAIDSKSKILEPYRSLRTNIRYTNLGAVKRSILVTSAIQGDGKTTKACNLAISFALDGKQVMLIDADLRRSSVHKVFNVEKEAGLSEFLTGQAGIAEISRPVFEGRITVIPAGKRPPNPAEILGSARLRELVQESLREHDLVLIDSPALVPVSDALLIAPYVDSTIIVGRALKTPLKAMQFTRDSLLRVNASIIGVIFNGVEQRKGYYPYYYNYYSYYHYYKSRYYQYYDEDEEMARLPKNFREFLLFAGRELLAEAGKSLSAAGSFIGGLWSAFRKRFLRVFLLLLSALALAGAGALFWRARAAQKEAGIPGNYQYIPPVSKSAPLSTVEMDPALQGSKRAVLGRLRGWLIALQESDFNQFKTFYSKSRFKYEGGGFAEWMRENRRAFSGLKGYRLKPQALRLKALEADYASLEFELERTEGWVLKTTSVLRFRLNFSLEEGEWKITGERRMQ